jgi:hypothetical protein
MLCCTSASVRSLAAVGVQFRRQRQGWPPAPGSCLQNKDTSSRTFKVSGNFASCSITPIRRGQRRIQPIQLHPSGIRQPPPGQQTQRRALPSAVRPQQRQHLPGCLSASMCASWATGSGGGSWRCKAGGVTSVRAVERVDGITCVHCGAEDWAVGACRKLRAMRCSMRW